MRFRRIVKIAINEIAYTQIEYLYMLLATDGQGKLRVVTHINFGLTFVLDSPEIAKKGILKTICTR